MSFRLKMFGGAVLLAEGSPVTGRATQRRRVALLALLGAAGEGGMSRDRLMSLLWPEADAERGRHLLSDSVYRINQALGGDAIVAINDALALNPERVATDYGEFTVACESGDWGTAIVTYGGPLLDGFHVGDSPEFERWVDAERDRAARRYARALEQLAAAREGQVREGRSEAHGMRLDQRSLRSFLANCTETIHRADP
jgi:serine/threonine-protein kinase